MAFGREKALDSVGGADPPKSGWPNDEEQRDEDGSEKKDQTHNERNGGKQTREPRQIRKAVRRDRRQKAKEDARKASQLSSSKLQRVESRVLFGEVFSRLADHPNDGVAICLGPWKRLGWPCSKLGRRFPQGINSISQLVIVFRIGLWRSWNC